METFVDTQLAYKVETFIRRVMLSTVSDLYHGLGKGWRCASVSMAGAQDFPSARTQLPRSRECRPRMGSHRSYPLPVRGRAMQIALALPRLVSQQLSAPVGPPAKEDADLKSQPRNLTLEIDLGYNGPNPLLSGFLCFFGSSASCCASFSFSSISSPAVPAIIGMVWVRTLPLCLRIGRRVLLQGLRVMLRCCGCTLGPVLLCLQACRLRFAT